MHPRAEFLIRELQLEPHPEGGFYRRVFESATHLPGGRAASSSIFFLLPLGGVSRWHRVDADEAWHFYEGDPLELLVAESPGEVRRELLGPVAEGSPRLAGRTLPGCLYPGGLQRGARLRIRRLSPAVRRPAGAAGMAVAGSRSALSLWGRTHSRLQGEVLP